MVVGYAHAKIVTTLRASILLTLVAGNATLANDETPSERVGDESDLPIETMTVYGTSNPIPVFDYPGHVTVIDRNELEARAPSSMSDALRDVPGLEFRGGPRRTGELPAIRGLTGENVLVLLDGVRQNFISAHDGRFFVDPEVVGRAEVLRGGASALYGSGAVGGVLAIESVAASDLSDQPWGFRFRTGYHSVNDEALGSATAFARRGGFDGIASFGIRQSGNISLGSGVDLPSDDEIDTALIKGRQALTDELTLDLSWQRFGNKVIEPNNGQGTLGTGNDVLDREVDKDIDSHTYKAGLAYYPAGNDWLALDMTAYVSNTDVVEFDPTLPRTTVREIGTVGFNLRNASRIVLGRTDTTLTVGADWYRDEQTGLDNRTMDRRRNGVPNAKSEFTGVFGQLETLIDTDIGRFLLIPGIRFDRFDNSPDIVSGGNNKDEAVSSRFSASFSPSSLGWLKLFGAYSEAFRAPSVNELYLSGVHFSIPHPVLFNPMRGSLVFASNNFTSNASLVPEQSVTFELGFGLDFSSVLTEGDRVQVKLSHFDTEADDLIGISVLSEPDPSCFVPPFFQPCTFGTTQSANINEAELSGWEAELSYQAASMYARLAFASIEGMDTTTGDDLGSLTPDRLALDIGTNLSEVDATLGLRLQIADDFKRRGASTDNIDGLTASGSFAIAGGVGVAEERDGYGVVDVYATWRPRIAEQRLRFDLGIDNVTDKNYERVYQGVSEPGRNYKLAVSWQLSP